MPGRSIGTAIYGAGKRASSRIGEARGSYQATAQEAIKGKFAADAQERNYGHAKSMLGEIHKRASQGSGVDFHVSSGDHVIKGNYTKHKIGDRLMDVQESAAIKDFKNSRKGSTTHDSRGFRVDQPDHYGGGRQRALEAGASNHETSPLAIGSKPILALPAGSSRVRDSEGPSSKPEEGSRHFVSDPAKGNREVDRTKPGSFETHLDANESSYLAERAAKLRTDAKGGVAGRGGSRLNTPSAGTNSPAVKNGVAGKKRSALDKRVDDWQNKYNAKMDDWHERANARIDKAAGN